MVVAGLVAFEAPTPVQAASGSECGANVNPIVCENQKPGTDPDVWDIDGAGDPSIQGFSTDISVNAGSKIDFKIDTNARAYTIDIYRTGYYQGLGARYIQSVPVTATLPQTQPQCITDSTTELYDCGTWNVSASWNVPSTAVSGVYVALLKRTDTGGASHIVFVVRNDGNHSDIVFQTSDPTWQAYNTYGGSDFYQGAANGRAYKISYNRPVVTRASTSHDFYFSSEFATVRFLERNGYDVSYLSGVDTDRRGGELLNHKVFLSVGHDEYWSATQRNNMEAARDAGVNLQFLSGNEGYWHTRYEKSADSSHTDYRTLVSYKETWANAKIDPTTEWTGTWRDPRFAGAANGGTEPENALTGTMYMVNDISAPLTVTSAEGKYRFWRNTGLSSLATGASANLGQGIVGYESDEDVDNGFRPAGLIRMSTTTAPTSQYLYDYGNTVAAGTTTHNITLYRAPSGALVFGAGTVQWGWGLDDTHDRDMPAAADVRLQQAEVNLLADMGAQPSTLMSTLQAATKSTDTTAPTVTVTSPTAGQVIASGTKVTATGTATDAGGVVAGVEVSQDGGATWRLATGTTSWSYTYFQQGAGTIDLKVRAIDDSGNYSTSGTSRSITVAGPYSAYGQAVPTTASADDNQGVELGLRFTPDRDGYVSGIRFYKGSANTGTHVGSLWNASGARLGTVTFTNESATGWQTAQFLNPVAVEAGQTYTASYTAPNGGYAAQTMYWPYAATPSSPISVGSGVGSAAPGVYGYAGTFPTSGWNETNYFVDVQFTLSDTSPLRISSRTPVPGASSVSPDTQISATFTRAADPATVGMTVKDATGANVVGTVTYDAATKTAWFSPAQALAPSTVYTVTPTAKDTAGVALDSGYEWSFTTRGADQADGQCPCSLFPESRVPDIGSYPDTDPVTVGVGFTPSAAGTITAMKFYKGAGNTGTHVGSLWDGSGNRLATVTFTGESASGWQTATFATPITVQAGARYVVSYYAPAGGYAVTAGFFASAYTRGPLSVSGNGAVYTYADAFPGQSSPTDYAVDVVFNPSTQAPTLVSTTPVAGALSVSPDASIAATFSAAIKPGFTGTVLVNGTAFTGAWSLSADAKTVSFVPSTVLPRDAAVSVSLTALAGVSGGNIADVSWSFTVAPPEDQTVVTLLGNSTPLVEADTSDNSSVSLGMAFQSSVSGTVRAVRFYKAASNVGTHVGTLWGPNGAKLAQVTFTGESASGWQRAAFSTPVQIDPNVTYTVSYLAPSGNYSYTSAGFAAPVVSGPLTAASPYNGRYGYGAGDSMPSSSWNSTNYFVDVEFAPDSVTPPVPSATQSLFTSELPTETEADTTPVELGTAFQVTEAGSALAIRYYKAAGATGTHVGTLWSSDGDILARVTFSDESASGWQRAVLETPVDLVPNQTYIVSYFAPMGRFAVTRYFFTAPKQSGRIVGVADNNGRFFYGPQGGFPTSSAASASYFADVEVTFGEPEVSPSVTAKTPAADMTNVDPSTAVISATLANASSGAITMTSGGSSVAGTSSFNASTGVVTFTPTAALERGKTYSATATVNGAALVGGTWSFTTLASPSITAKTPAADATNVDPSTAVISATLANASSGAITVTSGGTSVAGTSSFNVSTGVVTFTPTAALQRTKTYTATATANGAAVSGGIWSFTTMGNPAITARTPASSATSVLVNAPITATISNASSAAITVTSSGSSVAGTSSFNASTGVVTFTPTAALGWSKTYSATATANGAALTGGTWSFTTIAQASRSSSSPAANATNVIPSGLNITATLSSGAQAGVITLKQGTADVAGTSTYNSSSRVVTFAPTAALDWSKTYTATVTANGGAVASGTWSFTTAASPVSLFTTGTPANENQNAGTAYQVGTRFKTSAAGVVTSIRYYKGSQNTGTHIGYLRSSNGSTVLAQVTFTGESTSGWQTAKLSAPVRLTANTEYRVTLYSSSGRYAYTSGGLSSVTTVAPLSTIATGGLAGSGTGNPSSTNSNKYWVDVVFNPDN